MTNEQYKDAQMALIKCSATLVKYDWYAFLSRVSAAQTVGPLMDPTKYRQAQDNLAAIKKLAETARDMSAANKALFTSVVETQIALGDVNSILPIGKAPL